MKCKNRAKLCFGHFKAGIPATGTPSTTSWVFCFQITCICLNQIKHLFSTQLTKNRTHYERDPPHTYCLFTDGLCTTSPGFIHLLYVERWTRVIASKYFCEVKLNKYGHFGGLWRITLCDTLLPFQEKQKRENLLIRNIKDVIRKPMAIGDSGHTRSVSWFWKCMMLRKMLLLRKVGDVYLGLLCIIFPTSYECMIILKV